MSEPGLRSLPARRPEPHSGNHRVRNQGRFCNIVGGVISPILANAYLHEVLDTWFERTVKPRLKGRASLIRYADDAVLVFEREEDARRVLDVLPKRFGKYGLTLHPEKTRLVPFQGLRPGAPPGPRDERPGTFEFLGFTHYWGRTLKGNWAVKPPYGRGPAHAGP